MIKVRNIPSVEKTGIVPTERLKKILGITLPKETFTKEQDRELRKYAREIEGRVDYQQLVREVMKITN
jgi:Ca2+-binding EF-hand superfamily protein